MQRLYVTSDFMLAGHLKAVLEQHHIPVMLKNAYLTGGAGELPPTEVWPELWVEEEDHALAEKLIADVLNADIGDVPPWTCPVCGESIEPQFAACWSCGAPAPSYISGGD